MSATNVLRFQSANEQTYGAMHTTLRGLYQPQGDTLSKQPVIIFCFGRGFVNGSRTDTDRVALGPLLCPARFRDGQHRLPPGHDEPDGPREGHARHIPRLAGRPFGGALLPQQRAPTASTPSRCLSQASVPGPSPPATTAYVDREAGQPASTFAVNGLKRFRAVATRFDKRAANYFATCCLIAALT